MTPEVLFRLRGLGLWPNNPLRGWGRIRGRSVKEEMKIVLREEVKCIYIGPIVSEENVHLRTSVRGS